LRRWLPRHIDIDRLSDAEIQDICQWRAEFPQLWRSKIPQFGGWGDQASF
jgi:hypothetical protein